MQLGSGIGAPVLGEDAVDELRAAVVGEDAEPEVTGRGGSLGPNLDDTGRLGLGEVEEQVLEGGRGRNRRRYGDRHGISGAASVVE